MKCKITNNTIIPFMSFGKMPLANGFLNKNEFKSEFFFNMEVGFSKKISLFQLNDHPSPKKMFSNKYPFYTGSSNFMKTHFKEYANWLKKNYLKSNSKMIEIGSNDGTFLSNFKNANLEYLGFEPSRNVALVAKRNNIKTINDFFNTNSIADLNKFKKNTDVICASNVICHIPNLKNLIYSIEKLLAKKGVFVFEEPYLGSMFNKVSYDQIYDEHIFMFSVNSIKKIFKLFDFDLIDALLQPTHGGSIRYIISRKKNYPINNRVNRLLSIENRKNLDNIESCINFKLKCEESKKRIIAKLKKFKENGKKICGYAATSKSTTILNYCNINNDVIDFICDTTKDKINKFTPGTHIPIVSMSHFYNNMPDIAYLFAWNHRNEIFAKEKDFVNKGGKWISHVTL